MGTVGQSLGRRACVPSSCPVVMTMEEWATTGQKTGQHGLTSRPFSCWWALVSYVMWIGRNFS